MFRATQKTSISFQPKLEEIKVEKIIVNGAQRITKTRVLKNPDSRINFDAYSLEDFIKSGKKIEQVNTKVITNLDSLVDLPDVPRETTEEEQPF